jgi:predicted acyl esterase
MCVAWQPATRPANLPSTVEFYGDIPYARPDGHLLYLDMYLPKDAKGKIPVIVAMRSISP